MKAVGLGEQPSSSGREGVVRQPRLVMMVDLYPGWTQKK